MRKLFPLYLILFLPVLCFADPVDHNDAGLVLLQHFDDAYSSTHTWDSSGNGNHGLLHGGLYEVGRVTGKYGGALNFDGVNDYVKIPDDDSLDFETGDFTIEMWIKGTFGSDGYLYYKRDGYQDHQLYFYVRADAKVSLLIDDQANGGDYGYAYTSGATLTNNTWYHIAGIRSGNNLYVYVNGEDKSSQIGTAVLVDVTSSDVAYIGTFSGSGDFFNGIIDEVAVYNRALSQGKIWEKYFDGTKTHIIQ